MANVNAASNTFNLPNYVGELFLVGKNRTPFLNMIGGLTGGRAVNVWEFPTSLEESHDTPTQPNITETASLTAPTAKTFVPTQHTNVCQIFQRAVSMSYARMSDNATLSGLSILGNNPISDPFEHQKARALEAIALDVEYTFLNGVYQRAANSGAETANKTRGILSAISTNVVAGSSGALSKAMINELVRAMADSGSPFAQPVLFCNSFQKQALSGIYGVSPMGSVPSSRTVGGVNIETILTDFAQVGVVYDPFMPADTVMIADLSVVAPTFLAVPGKGHMFYEPLSKTGAGETGMLYGQIGLAYGPETYHGKITGLATE